VFDGDPVPKPNIFERPLKLLKQELDIKRSLIEQGIDPLIANAIIGYRAREIPFIYGSLPEEGSFSGESQPGLSEYWFGSTVAIHNLTEENDWKEQIPEVIVTWGSSVKDRDLNNPDGRKITRQETKNIGDGRFLTVNYVNVSKMGALDGEIDSISLNVPESIFVSSNGKERWRYYNYLFRRRNPISMEGVPGGNLRKNDQIMHEWTLSKDAIGVSTFMSNGYNSMRIFRMHSIFVVKEDYANARKLPHLPYKQQHLLETSLKKKGSKELKIKFGALEKKANELIRKLIIHVVTKFSSDTYPVSEANRLEEISRINIVDKLIDNPGSIVTSGKSMENASRKSRFDLAVQFAKLVRNGEFKNWLVGMNNEAGDTFVKELTEAGTLSLYDYFDTTINDRTDLVQWIKDALESKKFTDLGVYLTHTEVEENSVKDEKYRKSYELVIEQLLLKYLDYIAKKYFKGIFE
jgi:hypothetical protein